MVDRELQKAIAIDIGGTNLAGAVINQNGEVLVRKNLPAEPHKGADSVLEKIFSITADLDSDEISGIGVGTPGPVDAEKELAKQVVNIPGWEDIELCKVLHKRFSKTVRMANDGNLAALGEYWKGAGQDSRVEIMLTLGTGIGGGIIIDGEIFSGARGFGGELGHMCIEFDGRECSCGSNGCIEAYASARSTVRRYIEHLDGKTVSDVLEQAEGRQENIEAKMIFDAAKEGEELARTVVHQTGLYLGSFCGTLINCFNPDVIIFGGGMSDAGNILFDVVHEKAGDQSLNDPFNSVDIKRAKLGNDAGLIGAAALLLL